MFPSIDWFLDQKPEEVKPMHDHTTALCKLCEAAVLNYTTLVKTIKHQCDCKTEHCPDFLCMCPQDDEENDDVTRQCNCHCDCDNCRGCKVNYLMNFDLYWINEFFNQDILHNQQRPFQRTSRLTQKSQTKNRKIQMKTKPASHRRQSLKRPCLLDTQRTNGSLSNASHR